MNLAYWFISVFALTLQVDSAFGLVEGIYCGIENCYDVLGVTRDDDKGKIMRAYRKIARLHHPDRQTNEEDRLKAEKRFPVIASAYETLRDETARKEYDYFLDNPEAMYYHYYQYYKRRYSPKVDIRIVAFVIISCISAYQYYGQYANYNQAVSYLTKEPKYRIQAKEIAKREGLLEMKQKRENGKKITKGQVREKEEDVIRTIILEKMDISDFANSPRGGGYSKPTVVKTLWLQLILSPYYLCSFLFWAVRWVVLFWIMKREFEEPEKEYLIRRNLGLSASQWETVSENDKQYYMSKELWIKSLYDIYAEERATELKEKLADDSSYKRYRRYMKKGGAGQIMFGPEDAPDDY